MKTQFSGGQPAHGAMDQPPYPQLVPLSPVRQLTAGRLLRRLPQLYCGLTLYGISMAFQIRASLGVDPWNVLHLGLTNKTGLSYGVITVLTGLAVLSAWVPLREKPGLGTISNAFVIGLVADPALRLLPAAQGWPLQATYLALGILLCGIASGLYIGSQFGPGPRDGLMTGLSRRTGLPVGRVRTGIELTVLAVGVLLGGPVGLGTILFALSIGPVVQWVLPRVTVSLPAPDAVSDQQQE